MIVVLSLLVSIAPLNINQDYDGALIRGAAASASVQAIENETFWHDNFGDYYPTDFSQNPLINGTVYVVTVEGTWSPWGAGHWMNVDDPPVGAYEEAPMYLGYGGPGRVGADPFYAFACIYGWDYALGMGWTSLPSPVGIRISLDFGASWTDSIRPENEVYNPTHKYEFKVVGKGERIGFRTIDSDAYDNYGMFKIVVAPEQTVPSAPQNLTVVAGDAQPHHWLRSLLRHERGQQHLGTCQHCRSIGAEHQCHWAGKWNNLLLRPQGGELGRRFGVV
jgi:hypothetical protein